jgi:ethanolamine utilization protein EutA
MSNLVKLIGLDFGTTTCSAVVADAQLQRSAIGRMEIDVQAEVFRSDMVFTPLLLDDRLDIPQVERLLDRWLEEAQVKPDQLFGGGALLTGLTAQKENATALVDLIRLRLGEALVATADDPCLESWLSFMGNCARLSQERPETCIVNLDIGGGTTNIALGRNRQVQRTGCLFVGARHVQVRPGTYEIVKLSPYARELFAHLHVDKDVGDALTKAEVDAFTAYCIRVLENVCIGRDEPFLDRLEQIRFRMPADAANVVFTFSGGVGELVYRYLQGAPWPTTTQFGDLGIDLAQRIVESSVWAESLRRARPEAGGRATVYGLLRHATEVSGSTLFLGAPAILPLSELPVLGRVRGNSADSELRDALTLVRQSGRGGCVQVRIGSHAAAAVRELGGRIARILQEDAFPATRPLVLLVEENLGKVLGQYVTRWGAMPLSVLVIDEVSLRDAQFVQIGAPRNQVVPVIYHGFLRSGDMS